MRIITGWGRTETDELSDVLREAQLPVVTKKTCSMAARKLGAKITDRMLCAGGGTKDTCNTVVYCYHNIIMTSIGHQIVRKNVL